MAGAVRRVVPLRWPDYRLDADLLAAAVTDRTRLILINTPHNPTGRVFDPTELAAVARIARAADLLDAIAAVKQFLTFVNGSPFQPAVAEALLMPEARFQAVAGDLQARSELLTSGLVAAGFDVRPSDGTYFVIADAAPLGYTDGTARCLDLPALVGVVAVPVQAFHDDPDIPSSLVRFAACKRPEVIAEAASRLAGLAGHRPQA
jgi:N-succinyldiaminopimelate aminotransferase